MPLPCECSFDTESGTCPDGEIRNVLIQMCSVSAGSPDEVTVLQGEDCYDQFIDLWEETGWDVDLFLYNSKWEGKPIILSLIRRGYRYVDTGRRGGMSRGCFYVLEDPTKIYKIMISNHTGHVLTMRDDLLQTVCSMEKAADMVRIEEPNWFSCLGENTKLHIDRSLYNRWYTLPEDDPERKLFLEYAKVDAYSQAMIARWLTERGRHDALTAASNGLLTALRMTYPNEDHDDWFSRWCFTHQFPPLSREMQDKVEESLQGGFVWGVVGVHRGIFCHGDYKSSYPKEYAFGKLFTGEVGRFLPGDVGFTEALERPMKNCMKWMVVSFAFRLKKGYLPAISGVICRNAYEPLKGAGNKKMIRGTVSHKLFTASYLEELGHHYDLTDIEYEEVWLAKPQTGKFREFIRKCYTEKEREELKGTMERDVWKRDMNAGVHGKTITKTHRKRVTYFDGVRETSEEISEPKLCSLIGFTGMMNARERLLRDCRKLIEAGHHVMMCDTDSVIADCTAEEFARAMGPESMIRSGGFYDIGRFELEKDKEGNLEFDELRCWGLKRYCEVNKGKFRKSAFAGMHDETQTGEEGLITYRGMKYAGLSQLPVDNVEFFAWTQPTKHWNGWCYVLEEQQKMARAEDIWYEYKSKQELMKELQERKRREHGI